MPCSLLQHNVGENLDCTQPADLQINAVTPILELAPHLSKKSVCDQILKWVLLEYWPLTAMVSSEWRPFRLQIDFSLHWRTTPINHVLLLQVLQSQPSAEVHLLKGQRWVQKWHYGKLREVPISVQEKALHIKCDRLGNFRETKCPQAGRREVSNAVSYWQTLVLERTNLVTAYPLPGILRWFPVVTTHTVSPQSCAVILVTAQWY